MQNHIKERILGSFILLGGGILLSSMLFRGEEPIATNKDSTVVVTNEQIKENSNNTAINNLTADYETEQRILAEKREQRAKQVAKREAEIRELLKKQTEARSKALEKAQKEVKKIEEEIVLTADDETSRANKQALLDDAKKAAEKLKSLQAEQLAIQEAELQAQKQRAEKAKKERQRIQALKKKQAEQLKAEQAKLANKNNKQSYVEARNKLKQARKQADNSAEKYAVQVALAGTQERADTLANQLKKYGYKVTTSKTSRGVRVVVGPEKGQQTAYALRNKLESDKRVNVSGAWVTKYSKVSKRKTSTKKPEAVQAKKTQKTDKIEKLINQKQSTATDKVKPEDKYNYGVQVAMAGDPKSRDALIEKLQKNGYKVKTSNTSRGTRIIVGGGMSKEAAKKLQAKVNNDKRIGISGAWLKRERKK